MHKFLYNCAKLNIIICIIKSLNEEFFEIFANIFTNLFDIYDYTYIHLQSHYYFNQV